MVVDPIAWRGNWFLHLIVSISPYLQPSTSLIADDDAHTGLSIQMRSCCSKSAHAECPCPLDAQQPRTEDIISKHGFSAALFGLLTFRRGNGGSRGAPGLLKAAEPGGLGTIVMRINEFSRIG